MLLSLLLSFVAPQGEYRAVLDLAGGELRFSVKLAQTTGSLCNGDRCLPFSAVRMEGDSVVLEMADFGARIVAAVKGDSLVGRYSNVGRRGPRTIPFRADRGAWTQTPAPKSLVGDWDAWFQGSTESTPRVLRFGNGKQGLEGTVVSNLGDSGYFWGRTVGDSFAIAHFDGSFVYLLTGSQQGDTLRGTFHAGLRAQTPFIATRSSGKPHLTPPTAVTKADNSQPFRWSFPDLDGRTVSSTDARFRQKVVLLDIFGTWCPTCHDAAPALVQLYKDYHGKGLEIVGLAFEAIGDTAIDIPLVRRYRDKYRIPFPLLVGGVSEQETVAASLPQLDGFTAFPTTIFLGKDGRVRRIHAGFYGPATGAQHEQIVREFRAEVEKLLAE